MFKGIKDNLRIWAEKGLCQQKRKANSKAEKFSDHNSELMGGFNSTLVTNEETFGKLEVRSKEGAQNKAQ